MKFHEVLKSNLNFKMRRVTTWSCIIIVLGLTAFSSLSRVQNAKERDYFLNSQENLSLFAAVSNMKWDNPIRHNYEIFSAVYEVHKALWNHVDIKKYYHPKHVQNIDSIEKGMLASLVKANKNFRASRHNQMYSEEYPGKGSDLTGYFPIIS